VTYRRTPLRRLINAVQTRSAWHVQPAEPDEAAPVLRAYLAREPITRPFFAVSDEDDDASFRAEADGHPVFRLVPA
jgi:hypothetical protein